eukprot:2032673-Pyramimonas_sp.AAC.1
MSQEAARRSGAQGAFRRGRRGAGSMPALAPEGRIAAAIQQRALDGQRRVGRRFGARPEEAC